MADSVSLKVLVDKKMNRVIYAESDEDFVDILFSFLTTPIGTIVRLTSNQSPTLRMGSLNNLYTSVESIGAKYFRSQGRKAMLLSSRNWAESLCKKLKLNIDGDAAATKHFLCRKLNCSHRLLCHYEEAICNCGAPMNRQKNLSETESKDHGGVFVKERTRFISSDDLLVMPVSTGKLLFGGVWCTNEVMTNQEGKITVKLMVSKSKNMVCYAEAKKDFVNLLVSFLGVPLGEMLVSPKLAFGFGYKNDLVGVEEGSQPTHYYRSPSGSALSEPTHYFRSSSGSAFCEEGLLTDSLVITPISSVFALSILNQLKIPLNDIKEKVVHVGKEEALRLLVSSFGPDSALTNCLHQGAKARTVGCHLVHAIKRRCGNPDVRIFVSTSKKMVGPLRGTKDRLWTLRKSGFNSNDHKEMLVSQYEQQMRIF
ncbi:hypothetical protein TIFTF001_000318 [Ficus carica]|uniref:Uncharacterized protein n=1 Tax=Ficus carica TaxID=3494 RepID=A0AA87YVE4_FICCA|nr:hypothetical protein TIFTF001_000318 [Ficus carica]